MAPAKLIWRGGGPASVMAGILLATGQITNLFRGDPQFDTVLGGNLILIAHVLLIFAFIALYGAQAGRSGVLGLLGTAMGVLGTTLIVTIVFADTAGAHSARAPPTDDVSSVRSTIPEAAGWILDSAYSVLGPPFFTVGLMLFGLATMALAGFPGVERSWSSARRGPSRGARSPTSTRAITFRAWRVHLFRARHGAHRSRFCVVGFSALVRRAQKKSIPKQPVVPAS
jgi:hypothetical protein